MKRYILKDDRLIAHNGLIAQNNLIANNDNVGFVVYDKNPYLIERPKTLKIYKHKKAKIIKNFFNIFDPEQEKYYRLYNEIYQIVVIILFDSSTILEEISIFYDYFDNTRIYKNKIFKFHNMDEIYDGEYLLKNIKYNIDHLDGLKIIKYTPGKIINVEMFDNNIINTSDDDCKLDYVINDSHYVFKTIIKLIDTAYYVKSKYYDICNKIIEEHNIIDKDYLYRNIIKFFVYKKNRYTYIKKIESHYNIKIRKKYVKNIFTTNVKFIDTTICSAFYIKLFFIYQNNKYHVFDIQPLVYNEETIKKIISLYDSFIKKMKNY